MEELVGQHLAVFHDDHPGGEEGEEPGQQEEGGVGEEDGEEDGEPQDVGLAVDLLDLQFALSPAFSLLGAAQVAKAGGIGIALPLFRRGKALKGLLRAVSLAAVAVHLLVPPFTARAENGRPCLAGPRKGGLCTLHPKVNPI